MAIAALVHTLNNHKNFDLFVNFVFLSLFLLFYFLITGEGGGSVTATVEWRKRFHNSNVHKLKPNSLFGRIFCLYVPS